MVIKSQRGFPMYTRKFKDIANIYIQDGEILKARGCDAGDVIVDIEREKESFKDIVIEEQGNISIYSSPERYDKYKNEIEILKNVYGDVFEKRVQVYCESNKSK